MSNIQTKGWHIDVTDQQVDAASNVLDRLNRTSYPIYYSEAHQSVSVSFGNRGFYLSIRHEGRMLNAPEWVQIAAFDMHGNFIIYPTFLETGDV